MGSGEGERSLGSFGMPCKQQNLFTTLWNLEQEMHSYQVRCGEESGYFLDLAVDEIDLLRRLVSDGREIDLRFHRDRLGGVVPLQLVEQRPLLRRHRLLTLQQDGALLLHVGNVRRHRSLTAPSENEHECQRIQNSAT